MTTGTIILLILTSPFIFALIVIVLACIYEFIRHIMMTKEERLAEYEIMRLKQEAKLEKRKNNFN